MEKVCKLTGISAPTLRNWERRYGFPAPERSGSGHRFYNSTDVEFLKKVTGWLSAGHNLSEISTCYRERYSPERTHQLQSEVSTSPELLDDVNYRVLLLYDCLLNFDTHKALSHYMVLNAKLNAELFFDRVLEVLLDKAKEDLQVAKITSVQEHFVTSFVRLRLTGAMCLDLPLAHSSKIVAAAQACEYNEGEVLLVAAHLKYRGYPTHYFGPNLSIEVITGLTLQLKPRCLVLSYPGSEKLQKDFAVIIKTQIPVVIRCEDIDLKDLQNLRVQMPLHVHISDKKCSSEVASFVEMICECK